MSDPYGPERRARDLAVMRDPERWPWPNRGIYLKRWLGDHMEHGTLRYVAGEFRFTDDFKPNVTVSGGVGLCDQLSKEGWVLD